MELGSAWEIIFQVVLQLCIYEAQRLVGLEPVIPFTSQKAEASLHTFIPNPNTLQYKSCTLRENYRHIHDL
jgi:hypothetical protein